MMILWELTVLTRNEKISSHILWKLKSTVGLGKIMDFTLMFIVTITLVLNFSPYSQSFVNLTDILSSPNVHLLTFLSLLQTENVIETLQTQANSQTGLTLFAPNDGAIAIDNVPWGNLSLAQLQSLLLSHALPEYFGDTSSGISTLRQLSPVTTMAGGQYTMSITYVSGTFYVNVSSSSSAQVLTVLTPTTYPTQVYEIDKVLMPEAIFGTNSLPPPPPPTPATATATSVWTNSTPPYTPHRSTFALLL
ncbi:fasciclin-like arabinogalactan protein 7 [Rhododendron vialii]|uniref:fasciclin-like arabinogalactan protein 7 n=1 Tax=Rhododendron vialii TaxID=182163 RepID=UPI00265F3903|nr:fasciclin-like arabinogalactan protein 7 [Rhododendron vialii]